MASQRKLVQKVEQEMKIHRQYLATLEKKPFLVPPDNNCLFRALACSANLPGPGYISLRQDVVDHMKSNCTKFLRFTYLEESEATAKEDFMEELEEIGKDEVWVGYESIMAASLVLNAPVVVTSGGSSGDVMKSNSYYYGASLPDIKPVHIGYLSYGIYYSVVPMENRESNLELSAWLKENWPVGTTSHPFSGRRPSHMCDCAPPCDCREYERAWLFTGGTRDGRPSEKAKTKKPEGEAMDLDLDDVMSRVTLLLCENGSVISQRYLLLRHLGLSRGALAEVEEVGGRARNQLSKGLDWWLEECTESHLAESEKQVIQTMLTRLEKALRRLKLNLSADLLRKNLSDTITWPKVK